MSESACLICKLDYIIVPILCQERTCLVPYYFDLSISIIGYASLLLLLSKIFMDILSEFMFKFIHDTRTPFFNNSVSISLLITSITSISLRAINLRLFLNIFTSYLSLVLMCLVNFHLLFQRSTQTKP